MVMRSFVFFLLLLVPAAGMAAAADWTTPWERDPETTPRYDETVAWCADLAAAHASLAMSDFGTSPEGRPLPLVIWDSDGLATPDAVHAAGRAVVLIEAGIHAGESCGKDAGMTLLRDLARDGGPGGVTVLLIPIFNVDGHERFGPFNRVNQNGPREMGWRVTAQNLNLNRDFVKADAPEMQAWLRLWNRWRPHFLIDIHSTDGADYQYPITYGLETHGNLDPGLTAWLERYLAAVDSRMEADGYPMAPYVSFVRWHDPRSGLRSWVAGPRFSQGYAAVRNRPGLLIEAHMLKPYPVRVQATRALLDHTLDHIAAEATTLRRLADAADAHTSSAAFRAEPLTVSWSTGDGSRPVEFRGVAYEQVTSELSGGDYFRYDADQPTTFTVDFFDQPRSEREVRLPEAYLIPPQWTDVIARLQLHGIAHERLDEAVELEVGGWRLEDCEWRSEPYEGRHPVSYRAVPFTEVRRFAPGTVVVDLAQPGARIAAHLLAPEGPDALLRWGFFDAVLTRVEYVESYVIETMMTEMVATDPALLDSLEARKADDPEFAANPWAIRDWFYRRTPFYDERAYVYPVAELISRAILDDLRTTPQF
jgi:hypothetical protein